MNYTTLLALAIAVAIMPACSSKTPSANEGSGFFKRLFSANTYKLYRINVQQGNEISADHFKRLEKGLNKEQVKYLLGESLTPTLFQKNRWDYSYYYISGTSTKQKRLAFSIFFERDKVVSICIHRKGQMLC